MKQKHVDWIDSVGCEVLKAGLKRQALRVGMLGRVLLREPTYNRTLGAKLARIFRKEHVIHTKEVSVVRLRDWDIEYKYHFFWYVFLDKDGGEIEFPEKNWCEYNAEDAIAAWRKIQEGGRAK